METVKETGGFKSRFLTNILHEYRTPLTLIISHLEVLKEKGIATKHISKTFDRFYQVDELNQRTYAGSSIGLALVKELAILHSGDVKVEPPKQDGCVFTFWHQNSITEEAIKSTPIIEQKFSFPIKEDNYKYVNKDSDFPLILVIEDYPELRNFIVKNLGHEYRYAEASNGLDGIKLAEELIPDLIISDVMMLKLNGFEMCEKLKNNLATSHIPIILLTAKAEQKDKIADLKTEADDYLIKFFSLEELKLRVKNVLNSKELLHEKIERLSLPTLTETPELNCIYRKFVDDLNECVKSNISNSQFGVIDLADAVFLSVSQLTRKLKTITGKTPADFIRNIRLEYAVKLLKDKASVSDVSWAVGFEDPVYFSKVFKKYFGYSPSTVKRE